MADIADIANGMITIVDPDGWGLSAWFVHHGVRLSHSRHPDGESVVLQLLGGQRALPGFEEEGVHARMTPRELRQAAAELLMIAHEYEGAQA